MISSVNFNQRSLELLERRNVSEQEVQDFAALLNEAAAERKSQSAKQVLSNMTPEELALIQKAHSLADRIQVHTLSEEGAQNLLTEPDHNQMVDLNNDGLVEVGIGKSMVFPPVNAPQYVKDAWHEATEGLSEQDTMLLQFTMHTAVFGIHLGDGPRPTFDPAKQWSSEGINQLFSQLKGNLEFRVNMDGWTNHNLMLKDFYEKFEAAISDSENSSFAGTSTTQAQNKAAESQIAQTHNFMQLILDARLNIDREKLEEIEAKMEAIANDPTLSEKQRKDMLAQLEKEKEDLLKEAKERTVEQEKQKVVQSSF